MAALCVYPAGEVKLLRRGAAAKASEPLRVCGGVPFVLGGVIFARGGEIVSGVGDVFGDACLIRLPGSWAMLPGDGEMGTGAFGLLV